MSNETSELLQFSNGPLPQRFEARAYFTGGRKEFALRPADALAYLNWCDEQGLLVLGFDTWLPTMPGPTVVNGGEFEGDALACRERIQVGQVEGGTDSVLNIWVQT
jgi:hypothetical protein